MKMNRIVYRVLLILSFLAVNALLLAGISALFSYLSTGADRSSRLHLPEELSSDYMPEITWAALTNEGRPIDSQTLSEIERDYLKAWKVRSISLEANNPYGLADYYTDSARVKLYSLIKLNKENGIHFKSSTIEHYPELAFFSADGKLAVLTDKNVVLSEEGYIKGKLISQKTEVASYQIMLLLEDGFWRIRHIVKLDAHK